MEYRYIIKKPDSCLDNEIKMFHELVLRGSKVKSKGLSGRILNCKFLAFCYDSNNEIIAISSIKRPLRSYVEKVIKKANLNRSPENLQYELGYSFTVLEHRKKGVNGTLKSHLLDAINDEDCLIFSTTAINSSQTFLKNHGFVCHGNPFDGENDNNIKYYEKKCGDSIINKFIDK